MKGFRLDKNEDPFHSKEQIEEREAFEKQKRMVWIGIIAGIPVVLVLLYFLYDWATYGGY